MGTFEDWLTTHGSSIAQALDAQRAPICDAVTAQLAKTFPTLCFDPSRFDAVTFRNTALQQTPIRFHRMLRVALVFHSLEVVEREYRWLWGLMPRYGVTRVHMIAQAGWYFNATRVCVPLAPRDRVFFNGLKTAVIQTIKRVTVVPPELAAASLAANQPGPPPPRR